MEIRKMDENDLKAVAGLEKECFSAPWSERSLSMELHNPCAIFWVAEASILLSSPSIVGRRIAPMPRAESSKSWNFL